MCSLCFYAYFMYLHTYNLLALWVLILAAVESTKCMISSLVHCAIYSVHRALCELPYMAPSLLVECMVVICYCVCKASCAVLCPFLATHTHSLVAAVCCILLCCDLISVHACGLYSTGRQCFLLWFYLFLFINL